MSGPYSIGSKLFPGLSKLIEEAGEMLQVAGKIMGTGGQLIHWDGTNLRQRMFEELADLEAAVQFFAAKNLKTEKERYEYAKRLDEKRTKYYEWHDAGDPPPEG